VEACGYRDVPACGRLRMSKKLEVVVDGLVYQLQDHGGISRLFSVILPRMCDIDDSLSMLLLTQGRLKQPVPVHQSITHRSLPQMERYMRPKRIWKFAVPGINRLMRQLYVGSGEGKIWHSTYYSLPENWRGFSVVTVHDMVFERFADMYSSQPAARFREQMRRCITEADVVICVSNTTREEIRHFYGREPRSVFVIAHACSENFRLMESSDNIPTLPTDKPFLLYVGSRAVYKSFDTVLKAYSMWSRRNDCDLIVAGPWWKMDEEQKLSELQIMDRVHLMTGVTDEVLCYLYNKAAAFVYPSLYEGFGIPLLEAMACGCPIVASRIPSTLEVAEQCPVYFEPGDVDDLIRAFEAVLSEGAHSRRVKDGLEKVKEYSWDRAAVQTIEAYRAVFS